MSSKTIPGPLLRLKARLQGRVVVVKYAGDEPPLRSELLSADQMAQHGKTLAGSHQLELGRGPDQLLTRLAENENLLLGVRDLLTEAVQGSRRIAQW